MKIYEVLKSDHDQIKALLRRIDRIADTDAKQRVVLFGDLKAPVNAHSEAEEKVFYASLKKHALIEDIAREGYVEHAVAGGLLETLAGLRANHPDWMPTFSVLMEALGNHVKEEEGEVFVDARKMLDAAVGEHMAKRMEKARDALLLDATA